MATFWEKVCTIILTLLSLALINFGLIILPTMLFSNSLWWLFFIIPCYLVGWWSIYCIINSCCIVFDINI